MNASIKIALEAQDYRYLRRALVQYRRLLGAVLVEQIWEKVNALLTLMDHEHLLLHVPDLSDTAIQESADDVG